MLPVRICHLITDLDLGGGAERTLVNLVTGLDRSRFDSDVVCLIEPGGMAQPLVEAGIRVTGLGMRRGRPNLASLMALVRHLRRTRPTILQTWLYHADVAGTLAAVIAPPRRLLWNLRCSDMTQVPGETSTRRILRMLAFLSRRPDAIVVNSQNGKLFHEAAGYHPRKWIDIPNGVDVQRFRPRPEEQARLRAEIGIAADATVIGLVARFHPMKDCETFLRAAVEFGQAHRDARFVLCGLDLDPDNAELMQSIKALGLDGRVAVLGRRLDVENVYPIFDVLALSSAFGEGFPNVLIEAMACGVPCVATDVGDSRAIIGDQGVVVPVRDPQALARGFETMLSRGPRAVGRSAREHVIAKYSLEQMRARYVELYTAFVPEASSAMPGAGLGAKGPAG